MATGNEDSFVFGNSLIPCSYHEAGHIVAAAAEGLALRPQGIKIYRLTDPATTGIALYWFNNFDGTPFGGRERESAMVALTAGVNSQVRISTESTIGSSEDTAEYHRLLQEHYSHDYQGTKDRLYVRIQRLLNNHWNAVVALVSAIIALPWIPVEAGECRECPDAKCKKQLDGGTIVTILAEFGITARVQ